MSDELEYSEEPNFMEVQKEEVRLDEDAKYMIKEAVHKIAYEEFNNSIDPIEIVRNWSAHLYVFEDNSLVLWAEIPGINSDLQIVIKPDHWSWRLDEMVKNWQ